jgi:hypothetical protein
MTVAQPNEVQEIWGRVKAWPQPMRVSLAAKILQSIDAEQTRPKKMLADLVGLWADMPDLADQDVERILDEERMRKYG